MAIVLSLVLVPEERNGELVLTMHGQSVRTEVGLDGHSFMDAGGMAQDGYRRLRMMLAAWGCEVKHGDA